MARLLEEQKRTLAQQPAQERAGQIRKPGTAQPQNTTRQPAEQQTTRQAQAPAELHTGTDKGTTQGGTGSGARTTVGTQQGSDVVAQAQAALNQQLQQFRGSNSSAIGDLVGQIMNRQPFEYDVGADPTYQALREIWTRDGLMAMEDTMGQAAQLTGGYGNSYAQTAGQQAYQGYLRGLNEMIPELKQAAQAEYDAETNALLQQYGILMEQEEQEYARYLDALEQQYRQDRDAVEDARYDREWQYQQDRDALSDQRYDREWEYQQGRDEIEDQRYAEEWAYAMQQDERDYALNLALTAYEMGDDSLVRALGINPEAYGVSYGSGGGAGGSGGSGSSKSGSDELQIDADSLAEVERYYGDVNESQIEALIAAGAIEEEIDGNTIYYRIVTKEKPKQENPSWEHGGHTFTGW